MKGSKLYSRTMRLLTTQFRNKGCMVHYPRVYIELKDKGIKVTDLLIVSMFVFTH